MHFHFLASFVFSAMCLSFLAFSESISTNQLGHNHAALSNDSKMLAVAAQLPEVKLFCVGFKKGSWEPVRQITGPGFCLSFPNITVVIELFSSFLFS